MALTQEQIQKAKEDLNQLKTKCHQLIEEVAKHKYAGSLLSKTVDYLNMCLQYKSDRFKGYKARKNQ